MSFNPTAARVERELKHASPLIGCRFDPAGRFLFASAHDMTVYRTDLLTGTVTPLKGHASWVRGMAFVPSGAKSAAAPLPRPAALPAAAGGQASVAPAPPPVPFTLVSSDYHGKLIWWDGAAASPTPTRTVEAHDGWVRAVAVSPDGKTVASCGNDHLVKLWSAKDGAPRGTLAGHASHVYNLAFHPDGTRLVSADLKGVVKDWDLKTGQAVRDFDAKVLNKYDTTFLADIGGARGMAFNPDGKSFAVCGISNVTNAFAGIGNPLVIAFAWADGKATQLKPKDAFQGTAWGVAFHPAGGVVAAGGGSGGGRVWFWTGDDPTSSHTVTVPSGARDMAVSPDGSRVAAAGANGTAYVYTFDPAPPPAAKAPAAKPKPKK